MKPRCHRSRARRSGLTLPVAVGIGLLAAACTTDPYVESVHQTSEEHYSEQPNAAAAAALMRVAVATRAAGDYASAINVLKRAHKLAPRDTAIMLELAESLAAVGAYNEAREIMAKAQDADPGNTRALRGLANTLVALTQPAMAIGHYRAALAIAPEAASYNGLGVALDALHRPDEAEKAYRDGLALAPHNASLIGNLGLSLALRGRLPEAIDLIAGEMRAGRSTAKLRQNLALVYGLAGRLHDAATVLRIDLDAASVRNNLAYYEMLGGLSAEQRRETVLGARAIVASRARAAALTAPAPAPAPPTGTAPGGKSPATAPAE